MYRRLRFIALRIERLRIKEAATEAIMEYYNKALDIIGKMDFTPAQMEQLLKFADKLVKRIK